jgi:hypothetical protein
VVVGAYREFFAATAAAAGSLTGLLFVALSVTGRRGMVSGPAVFQQVRAAAALLAFTNALVVSLFALVPTTNAGYPAIALGVIGILFSGAGLRSILSSGSTLREQWRQHVLVTFLMVIFGTELVAGIAAVARPAAGMPLQVIGYALVTSLIVGIARAWEIVGDRDTGILASLAVLTGRTSPDGTPPATAQPGGAAQPGGGPETEPEAPATDPPGDR